MKAVLLSKYRPRSGTATPANMLEVLAEECHAAIRHRRHSCSRSQYRWSCCADRALPDFCNIPSTHHAPSFSRSKVLNPESSKTMTSRIPRISAGHLEDQRVIKHPRGLMQWFEIQLRRFLLGIQVSVDDGVQSHHKFPCGVADRHCARAEMRLDLYSR